MKNDDGLSVLQFAADRGLVICVQTMLSTKGVSVIPYKHTNENNEPAYEMDVSNLCPEYFVQKDGMYKTMSNDVHQEKVSFLDALAQVKPPHKAGEILESIPMMSLTWLEWRVTQWFHLLWMIVHIVFMVFATIEITTSDYSTVWSAGSSVLCVFILVYTLFLTVLHLLVKIMKRRPNRVQAKQSVDTSRKKYEKDNEGIYDWILSAVLTIISETVLIVELLFTGFTWAVFAPKMTNIDMTGHVWIEGFFLLFGWLMLLFPLTSFSLIYKLISVLKYIVIRDMFPWIIIYTTISVGFALAIKLQIDQLPSSSSCEDLTGFLNKTGHTFFELVIMTSGLDTDLKHVRNLACLFEHESKSVSVILFLITLYAVISAVVLLNMLIAIMSNTVTEAQRDKGWRQYQVSWVFELKCNMNAFTYEIPCSSELCFKL